MTLTNFLTGSAQLSGLLFIVTSMLAMGMSLTIPMIIQPLKNARRVIMALLANGDWPFIGRSRGECPQCDGVRHGAAHGSTPRGGYAGGSVRGVGGKVVRQTGRIYTGR